MLNSNIPQAFLDILQDASTTKPGGISGARHKLQAGVPILLIQGCVKPTALLPKEVLVPRESHEIILMAACKS